MAGSVPGSGRAADRPTAVERFTARARSARAPRRRLVGLVTAAALLAALALWAVWWSTLLDARKVEVVGAHRVPLEEIKATAAVPLGRPLARLDTAAVARRVEKIPLIADVAVSRHWPHTVRIAVEERQPAVAVPAVDGLLLIDRTGVAFDTVSDRPAGVPLVTGENAAGLGASGVHAVVETLAAVPAAVRAKVTEVAVPSADSVTLTLRDGVQVIWGSAEDGARKATVLTALMRTKAKVYDVSTPDAPATRG
jgi:cell division protein FtsQ